MDKKRVVTSIIIVTILIYSMVVFVYNNSFGHSVNNTKNENDLVSLENETELVFLESGRYEIPEDTAEEKVIEAVVEFKGKTINIPKSKVETNSSEDAEKNKKTGGDVVNIATFETTISERKGIDVSSYQGVIDWPTVKASGVEFVMIRVGYRGQTSGGIYEDKYFVRNITHAIGNGIPVGIYFYSTAINEEEALEEAAWVCNKIAPYRITYPVVYDFEDYGNYRCRDVDGAQGTKDALAFFDYVSSKGYTTMMYANKYQITTLLSRSSFGKFWLAHYVTGAPEVKSSYTGSYQMWQYSSKGSVPGIVGYVDMDIAYFGFTTNEEDAHVHDFSSFLETKVEATCTSTGIDIYRCECGLFKEVESPKKDHVREVVIRNGEEVTICSVCGEELPPETGNTTNEVGNNTITNTTTNDVTDTNEVSDPTNEVINTTIDVPTTNETDNTNTTNESG